MRYSRCKKVGKNNPKADNEIRMEWNRTVDRAIVNGISETEVVEIKKPEITDRVKESVEQNEDYFVFCNFWRLYKSL